MPDLADLDPDTQARVQVFVDRLRESMDAWVDRVVRLTREYIPGYSVVSDEEIGGSARAVMEGLISEVKSLRLPDDVERLRLEGLALRRVALGMPLDTLALGYRLGSREMLSLMDEVAREVGLPKDLVLAMHDSTWEFANEAASVFARIQRDLTVERARFDAERRSAFARAILGGAISLGEIQRDALLFGVDPHADYVPIAARAATPRAADDLRRAIASAVHAVPDRLLFVELGTILGCIASSVPENVAGQLIAVGPRLPLDSLGSGFDEATLVLETAERFGVSGAVRLADLGPKPLILCATRAAIGLEDRYLGSLAGDGRTSREIEETTRVYLERDQQVSEVAELLTVHPNTVRYRVNRFRELTGLDVRRTEDLVTAWWLLNRRRADRLR